MNHFESKCAAMTIFLGASGSNVYTRLVKSTFPIGVDPANGVYGVRPVVARDHSLSPHANQVWRRRTRCNFVPECLFGVSNSAHVDAAT